MSQTERKQLGQLSRDYSRGQLLESEVLADPIAQLGRWLDEAIAAGISQPNAVTLATAGAGGVPTARVVLVKSFDAEGLVFGTNYASRKGADIGANPRATMLFFWEALERQVRVEGAIAKTTQAESDRLFHERPRLAQLAAWASHQSRGIGSRADLEKKLAEVSARFGEGAVPLPEFWGGYRLMPATMEFWQGRPGRLHDRLLYSRHGDAWSIERLAP